MTAYRTLAIRVALLPAFEGVQGYVFQNAQTGTAPLFRYYNGVEHFYTTNFGELGGGRDGYVLEGIQCYIFN